MCSNGIHSVADWREIIVSVVMSLFGLSIVDDLFCSKGDTIDNLH